MRVPKILAKFGAGEMLGGSVVTVDLRRQSQPRSEIADHVGKHLSKRCTASLADLDAGRSLRGKPAYSLPYSKSRRVKSENVWRLAAAKSTFDVSLPRHRWPASGRAQSH